MYIYCSECKNKKVDGEMLKMTWQKLMFVHVNLFQKHLFLHQLTHNMTKDCLLKVQYMKMARSEHVLNVNCSEYQNKSKKQFVYTTCSELVVFVYWTGKSMNNLLSYCGLVDPRISASGKDLPVQTDAKNYSFLSSHTYLQLI